MTLAALQLNDQALLIQAEDGTLYVEPGFARLTPAGIETGEDARAAAWREPQHIYNQYWCHLNQSPLPSKREHARHHADIAYVQLGHLWHKAGSPESLIVLVPGSFSDDQLSLLLGMVSALPCTTIAVIDSALAACFQVTRDTLFVDMQLHQTVLSVCHPGVSARSIVDQEVFPDLGVLQLQNSVARHISNMLIDTYRYDPLHTSASEQAIFNEIPAWLMRLHWENEVSATLSSDQGELTFILRREDVSKLVSERLANLRSFIAKHPGSETVLSHTSGLLTGLAADFSTASVAAQTAILDNMFLYYPQIPEQTPDLYRVRSLQRAAAVPGHVDASDRLATHVLYQDQALTLHRPVSILLNKGSIRLSNEINHEAELVILIKNQSLEVVRSAPGTDTTLPATCRPGESIMVGGHQLKLIEVRDG